MSCGHGHVYPEPDGHRARCGGPKVCGPCALDFARRFAGADGRPDHGGCRTAFSAIRDIAAETHRGERAWTALSEIDQIARKALA